MPELPEVECVRLGLDSTLGCRIQKVSWNYPKLWDQLSLPPELLEGQTLQQTHRLGKYLILEFDQHQLLMHLGMSGVFLLQDHDAPARPHTHLCLKLEDQRELRFSDPRKFGHLHLALNSERFARWDKLGPDALTRAFHSQYFYQKCQKSTREIKVFLLDQTVVAGVGNIYASEALFRAGIDPRRSALSLSLEECSELVKASKWIMRKSVQERGTTFSDYRLTNGRGGDFQGFLKVFQKPGETCPKCKSSEILKIEQDKRSTFYCDNCQI